MNKVPHMNMDVSKTVDLVKSLYHLGKIGMTEKGPKLLDQQVVVVPRDLFRELIELYANDPVMEYTIYHVMKRSVYRFCANIDEEQDLDPAEMLQVLLQLTKLNGYGHIEINDYDRESRTAAFYVRDLPSEDVAPGYTFKGDTYWAGMLAGGMSYVFNEEVDGLETQCILEDHNSCRFLVAPRETLESKHPELYEQKFEIDAPTEAQIMDDDSD